MCLLLYKVVWINNISSKNKNSKVVLPESNVKLPKEKKKNPVVEIC